MKLYIIVFGSLLLINGILIIKNEKYGREEGLPFGNFFKGKTAVVIGFVLALVGAISIILGIILSRVSGISD